MSLKLITAMALLLSTTAANASTDRVLDGKTITSGAAILTLPTTTDTVVGRASTDTLTNKTLTSPAITTPTGIVKGDVGLGNVDNTSDATKNAASVTLTNKTLTAPVIATIVSGAGTSTLPTVTGTLLSTAAAVTVAQGGTGLATLTTGNVILGAGTSTPTFVAPGTSGNVLTSNGSTWTSAAPASAAPTITGTRASPSDIVAGTGIAFTGAAYEQIWFIQGSGGAVTVTANPQIAAGTSVGQHLKLIGRSATNTVTLADGNGLSLNGTWVGGLDSVLILVWDGTNFVEESRR